MTRWCQSTDTASKSLVYDLFQNPIGNNSDQDYEEAVKAVAATVFLGKLDSVNRFGCRSLFLFKAEQRLSVTCFIWQTAFDHCLDSCRAPYLPSRYGATPRGAN